MAIGSIIRRRRDELSLSQGRVAMMAGVSQGYLSKLEKGLVKSPRAASLFSLASVLAIDPQHLLKEAGYRVSGRVHHLPDRPGRALWTSWQSLPPCLGAHTGWVCQACRDWPQRYRLAPPVRLAVGRR
ncbi:MAG: helix-turn-helix transcriptional regulator [Chloroflexi bacterium]|nr:helix-turn-helix transcriptional regulator [Chloroflexota bacterium]